MNILLRKQVYQFFLFVATFSVFLAQSKISSAQTVEQSKTNKIIRILAIGNSFSEDAMEHFLYGLANAGGHQVIIGNLFIGASDLDLHWFIYEAEGSALLNNASECHRLFGYPRVTIREVIDITATWLQQGGEELGKDTHFQERGGKF